MEIKVKNWYKTVDGSLVYVDYIIPKTTKADYPVIGLLKDGTAGTWTREGKYYFKAAQGDDRDLTELIGNRLQLEVKENHFYKTRSGGVAHVAKIYENNELYGLDVFVIGMVQLPGAGITWRKQTWSLEGQASGSTRSTEDLVDELGETYENIL